MPTTFDPNGFLTSYADAFAQDDAPLIADFYATPSLTIRADGSRHVLSSTTEVIPFFAAVLKVYRAEGMSRFEPSDDATRELGEGCAELDCTWSMQRANGSEIRRWRQTYLFCPSEDGRWRIAVSVIHAPSPP